MTYDRLADSVLDVAYTELDGSYPSFAVVFAIRGRDPPLITVPGDLAAASNS
jgi:hypothetical protein